MEEWKSIPGIEGKYEASNFGRIRNSQGIVLLQQRRGNYYRIGLYSPKRRRSILYSVHRLVAAAFLEQSKDKIQVNHIDGDGSNNLLSNLEWVTPSQNMKHGYDCNYRPKGSQLAQAKLTELTVAYIKVLFPYFSERKLAKMFNVGRATIRGIKTGSTWSHVNVR